MRKKKEEPVAVPEQQPDLYTKRAILLSNKYRRYSCLLEALLSDDRDYTMQEVESLLLKTLKGQVK